MCILAGNGSKLKMMRVTTCIPSHVQITCRSCMNIAREPLVLSTTINM